MKLILVCSGRIVNGCCYKVTHIEKNKYRVIDIRLCREDRQWLLVSSQTGLHQEYLAELDRLDTSLFLHVDKCPAHAADWDFNTRCQGDNKFKYPDILQVGNTGYKYTYPPILQVGIIYNNMLYILNCCKG